MKKLYMTIAAMAMAMMTVTGTAMAQWAPEPKMSGYTDKDLQRCGEIVTGISQKKLDGDDSWKEGFKKYLGGLCGQLIEENTAPSAKPACTTPCLTSEQRKARAKAWRDLMNTVNALKKGLEELKAALVALLDDFNKLGLRVTALEDAVADLQGRMAKAEGRLDGHDKKIAELEKGLADEAKEREDGDKEIYEYIDMMWISTAFKFDLGAVVLGSTDFRGVGIVAGGLRVALDFGATDRFRPVFHGSVGGGHGRWANVVWEVGTSQEIRVNDKGTVWLGPAITWSHENVLDANYNTFLGAGISLRVLFPESHHGYFSAAIFGGDNMYFVPDKTGEYDEVMAHHFGVGIQLSVGYSIFQDIRKK